MSAPKPTITSQQTMAKVNEIRAEQAQANRLSQFAIPLGCVLRDKFDFSNAQQYTDWADMAWKAAEAFLAKEQSLVGPLNDKLQEAVNEHNELIQIETNAAKQAEAKSKARQEPLRSLPDPVPEVTPHPAAESSPGGEK